MSAVVVFDLDDTLVNTSHLRSLRDAQRWGEIDSKISKVKRFKGVGAMWKALRAFGCEIAVVTTAPRHYAENVLAVVGLDCDVLVAAKDTRFGKPDAAPTRRALMELGWPKKTEAFVVGDRCVDIASGVSSCAWTIGATWATHNLRDLMLSYPKYLASDPREASSMILRILKGKEVPAYDWLVAEKPKFWLRSPNWDRRQYLSSADLDYRFARVYRGRGASWSCYLVQTFKTKNVRQASHKAAAADIFARDLTMRGIPKGSWILFVMPSALEGTSEYDDRWELIAERLRPLCKKKDWKICQAIKPKVASIPAHQQSASSKDREPATISKRLKWVGGIPADAERVTVIDDVVTKGGHLRSYHDLVRKHCPNASITLLAWAAFSSQPWHACDSAFDI